MKKYIDISEYNGHYIQQNINDSSFVVFGEIRSGYIIDLSFSPRKKILYKASSLSEMHRKIEKSGINRKPRRH